MMKRLLACLLAASLSLPCPAKESDVRIDGAAPGEWTQDWDAAVALSKEKDVPVFALFTGSDWCPYCVKLHDRIFAKDGWKDGIRDQVLLVYVDFPKDKSKVPEKYRDRNRTLAKRYGIEGYPTCLLLSVDELKPVMQYGYDDSDTPESFAKDVIEYVPLAKHGGLQSLLSEKEWAQYQEARAKLDKAEEKLEAAFSALRAKAEAMEKEGKNRTEIMEALKADQEATKPLVKAYEAATKVVNALERRAVKKAAGAMGAAAEPKAEEK